MIFAVLFIIFIAVKIFLWLSKTLIWFVLLAGANSKVTGVVYLLFLNTMSTPCLIFLVRALSCFIVSDGWRLTKMFLLLLSFLSFSVVFWTDYLVIVTFDLGGVFASSTRRIVSIGSLLLLSVEISMVPGSDGCRIIVRVYWYLGYLLTSILVIISVGVFLILVSCT